MEKLADLNLGNAILSGAIALGFFGFLVLIIRLVFSGFMAMLSKAGIKFPNRKK